MSNLAAELAALLPEERKLLELTLREKGIDLSQYQIPQRDEHSDAYPLSFSQRRLWFIQQLDPESSAYHIYTPMRMRGELDVSALRRAVARLVDRHEALRTTFEVREGEPMQVVHGVFPGEPLSVIDLRALAEDRRSAEAHRVASRHVQTPFDLTRGPLLRPGLIELGGGEHSLLLTMHHIVSDGWSMGVLFRELLAAYGAETEGREPEFEPLPIQYVDYALWQQRPSQVESFEKQLDYWKEQLGDAPKMLDLPTDRPHPPIQTHRGASVFFEIDPPRLEGLRTLARGEKTTLFVALLALYQALLGRWCGVDDLSVGSPVAGRNRSELEGLIGFFVSTVVLRGRLDGDPSLRQLLGRLGEVNAGANAHQELPFERVVEALQPERTLDRPPIYQVGFGFQADPGGGIEVQEVTFRPQPLDNPTAQVEMTLTITETRGGARGEWIYNTDLFDRTTARRLMRRYQAVLDAAVAEPDRPLSELTGIPAAERHQQLVEWNSPEGSRVADETAFGLFAAGAEENPERIAVVFEGGTLSYGELARRAGALAHRLRDVGVGPESVVALAAERSPEMVVGLLGILAAGGAYLPLDPDLPADRLAFMLEDAGVRVLLAGPGAEGISAEGVAAEGLERLELTEIPDEAEPIECRVGGENAIYLIYTSGSTGQPKGVVVRQGALAQRLLWSLGHEDLGPEPVYLQKTPLSFDVSVAEIFVPLTKGGHMVLARPGGQWDVSYLLDLIAQERVTVSSFVPSMYTVLLERPEFARCRSLKRLYTAAEAVSPELAKQLDEKIGDGKLGVELFNRYGPTEATIGITEWRCGGDAHTVPIGRPMASAEVLILDPGFEPVGIGAVGQIWAAGELLARGYHRRPALTAERFVPHPLSSRPGARLYRTGDLGRHRGDGAIEFLGRADHQVKVRGFRIELGEIETALVDHPAVRRAAVVDRRESSGLVQLAGFAEAGPETDPQELRAFLAERLPAYMVPAQISIHEALPLLPNGKIDRRSLPETEIERPTAERVAPRGGLERQIAEIWAEVLGLDEVGVQDNFFDLGGHSLLLVKVQSRLTEVLGREVPVVELFRSPTVASLAAALGGGRERRELGRERAASRRQARGRGTAIAIVGRTCRFPGASNVEEFWQNLAAGVESVSFWSEEELLAGGVSKEMVANPAYVPAMATIEDPENFDAGLFGVNPREAQLMDPQQRVFLQCCWEALEQAGIDPESFQDGGRRSIGVFAGIGATRYWWNLLFNPELAPMFGTLQVALGNEKDFLPTRVSYKLGLEGPSVNVQTACSTSLVATHLACQALLDGECDAALAGGVQITDLKPAGYVYEPDGILSSDGHCRAFDVRGEGATPGQGAGAVVLKRLDDALADGDTIYAVIRGSAINNDGSEKVGFTAPSVGGQSRVIAEAQAMAGVESGEIGYVEAHGTATNLGDPIEVEALRSVFGPGPEKSCGLGSVKTNFGHLGAAAGVAGLMKAVLALEHGEIPPSLHFETPDPKLELDKTPFFVPTELTPWPQNGAPRRAGVSSFGLGGTNAHVVLEEAPALEPAGPSRPWQLLLLSAKTREALDASGARLLEHLRDRSEDELADVAHTLRLGRRRLATRRALVVRDRSDALELLETPDPRRILETVEERVERSAAFLLPGVGDHYPQMGRELYETEPTFRRVIDRCSEVASPLLGEDLLRAIYPERAEESPENAKPEIDFKRLVGRGGEADAAERELQRTALAQPAVFAVTVALAELLREWGLEPEALIGYSLGEYSAAHLAGVLELDDAMRLVVERAKLIETVEEGAMLAVPLGEDEVRPLLGEKLALAATNGPRVSVVSGPAGAIAELEETLGERELTTQRLQSRHAFHSPMMEVATDRFREVLAKVEFAEPRVPYLSNVTGTWIKAEEARDPEYWVRHLCQTVRFTEGLGELLSGAGGRMLVEVGPGQALSTSVRQHPALDAEAEVVATMRDGREKLSDSAFLLGAAARLWLGGARLDWTGFAIHERRRRLPLPTYPFEEKRYWIEATAAPGFGGAPRRGRNDDVGEWFYAPSWRRTAPLPAPETVAEGLDWLVFADPDGLAEEAAERLASAGHRPTLVRAGTGFRVVEEGVFEIAPGAKGDYRELAAALAEAGRLPSRVAHFWGADAGGAEEEVADTESMEGFQRIQERGPLSFLYLVQALLGQKLAEPVTLVAVTAGLREVTGREPLHPERSTVIGALRVIPQEYRDFPCRSVDVELAPAGSPARRELVAAIAAELAAGAPEIGVALRRDGRRVEEYEKVAVHAEATAPLREEGVYFLTGGLGRIGLRLAGFLARECRAKLVLTGRSPFPEHDTWDDVLEKDGESPVARKIRWLRQLEEAGAEVMTIRADIADGEAIAAAVAAGRERFGALNGVIHLAGAVGEGLRAPVEATGLEHLGHHFRPKVAGVVALERALEAVPPEELAEELDFCCTFSSLATVLGGLGFAAYTAANAFLDAHAHHRNRTSAVPWIAGCWDGWPASPIDLELAPDPDTVPQSPMSADDSVEAFRRLLSLKGLPQVVVSTEELAPKLQDWLGGGPEKEIGEEGEGTLKGERPNLKTPFVAPSDEVEGELAEIWGELLGLEEVGVHDHFFELGGDSLLATQMLSQIRRRLEVQMGFADFFEAPTVAGLAEIARRESEEDEGELSELEALLGEIEDLPEDELDTWLDDDGEEP